MSIDTKQLMSIERAADRLRALERRLREDAQEPVYGETEEEVAAERARLNAYDSVADQLAALLDALESEIRAL